MKKIVLVVVAVLVAVGVAAQSHSFGVTSYVRYEQFDFDAWVHSDSNHHGKGISSRILYPITHEAMQFEDVVQYNYTDSPTGVKIVGLSAVIENRGELTYPMSPSEYLLLYDASTDTFQLKAMVQWEEADTAGRPFYEYMLNTITLNTIDSSYHSVISSGSGAPYIRIFDYYFDKPIVIYDSFYVGATSRFWLFSPEEAITPSRSGYITHVTEKMPNMPYYLPSLWKIYHYNSHGGNYTPYQWHWVMSDQFLMVLPIIEVVDTSFANAPECPRVSGLFLRGNYTDTVTLQWEQDSLHREFELSYGRDGIAPEDGTIVRLNNTTRWQFTDTAYCDTPMVAYVRTVCREYDTLRWSDWSSMRWQLHYERPADTTQHEEIEVPDDRSDLSRFVRLMPNPASGSVVVMSSYGIDGLEVYDVRGNRVLEHKVEGRGRSVGFDVTGWTKGTYVVLVHTPTGIATKRLVVE
ncbi:MAG: T9SS type A sorting domain-containing protein [Bacteroidales bacterium]|nr:T9SS type A sorting domain-containing protein [Bacteroidales bacterium]